MEQAKMDKSIEQLKNEVHEIHKQIAREIRQVMKRSKFIFYTQIEDKVALKEFESFSSGIKNALQEIAQHEQSSAVRTALHRKLAQELTFVMRQVDITYKKLHKSLELDEMNPKPKPLKEVDINKERPSAAEKLLEQKSAAKQKLEEEHENFKVESCKRCKETELLIADLKHQLARSDEKNAKFRQLSEQLSAEVAELKAALEEIKSRDK